MLLFPLNVARGDKEKKRENKKKKLSTTFNRWSDTRCVTSTCWIILLLPLSVARGGKLIETNNGKIILAFHWIKHVNWYEVSHGGLLNNVASHKVVRCVTSQYRKIRRLNYPSTALQQVNRYRECHGGWKHLLPLNNTQTANKASDDQRMCHVRWITFLPSLRDAHGGRNPTGGGWKVTKNDGKVC